MSNVDTPEKAEIERIEDSLHELLSAISEIDCRRAEAEPDPHDDSTFKVWSISDLERWGAEDAKRTAAGRFANRLEGDPVRNALKAAIKPLGERLHEIGGLKLMQDVCDRVAERDTAHAGSRMTIMDRCWDAVGAQSPDGGWWS